MSCVDGSQAVNGSTYAGSFPYSLISVNPGMYWVEEMTNSTSLSRNPQSAPLYAFIYPPYTNTSISSVIVSSTGADITTCGWEVLPCLSLTGSQKSYPNASTILLMEGNHSSDTACISFAERNVTIQPFTETSSCESVSFTVSSSHTSSDIFALTTASSNVTMNTLTISIAEMLFGGRYLFTLTSGSVLTLTHIRINSTAGLSTTRNTSLFKIPSNASLSCIDVHIFNITRSSGDGDSLFHTSTSLNALHPQGMEELFMQ